MLSPSQAFTFTNLLYIHSISPLSTPNCNVVQLSGDRPIILVLLQKQAMTIITTSFYDAHTDPIFKNICILPLNDMYPTEIGKIMFQYKTVLLPDIFNNTFLRRHQVHSHDTRNARNTFTGKSSKISKMSSSVYRVELSPCEDFLLYAPNNVDDCVVSCDFFCFFQEQGELIQTLFLLANVPNPKGNDYHDFVARPLKKYVFVIPPSEEQEKKKA